MSPESANDELAHAVRNLDAVSNGYRWMRQLRDGLGARGVSSTQWADVVPNALAEIDRLSALASTALLDAAAARRERA